MTEAAERPRSEQAAPGGRLRAFTTSALFYAAGCAAGLAAWRRLAPPVDFRPPPALVQDMVFIATGPAVGERRQGFWLDRFETTRGAFDAFAREARAETRPSTGPSDLPVSYVTHDDASAFARWRGKRLPTAAEWDAAARSPGGMRFPWGDGFVPACANTLELRLYEPVRVGTFESGRTAAGVYDLFGNVAEWTATPFGPPSDGYFVVRGSSFFSSGSAPTEGLPGGTDQKSRRDAFALNVGFRCAADAEAAEADRALRADIARLAVRDPAGVLLQRLPAEARLRRGGERARTLLRETAASNAGRADAAGVVARCLALADEVR